MSVPTRANIDLRVASVLLAAEALSTPVDLFRIAKTRRVIRVSAKQMIPRGGLESVSDGFRVYIQDLKCDGEAELTTESELSARQRFVFAHELAHTLFYRLGHDRPVLLPNIPEEPELEKWCDSAAARMLVPTELLQSRMRMDPRLSAAGVVRLAAEFKVSTEVVLQRIADVGSSDANRAVILINEIGAREGEVRAFWYGAEFLPLTPRPDIYDKVSEMPDPMWLRAIRAPEGETWREQRSGRTIVCRKVRERPGSRRFLIEAGVET